MSQSQLGNIQYEISKSYKFDIILIEKNENNYGNIILNKFTILEFVFFKYIECIFDTVA